MPHGQDLMQQHDVFVCIKPAASGADGGRRQKPLPVIMLQGAHGHIHFSCHLSHCHILCGNGFFHFHSSTSCMQYKS